MRGKKPAPAKTNVVTGVFPVADVELTEPNWKEKPADDKWAQRAANLASEYWAGAIANMQRLGTLGDENRRAIELAATQYARWKLAEAHVAKHGPVVAAPRTGVPMQNPYLSIANKAAELLIKLEADLGLPPSMRGRVTKAESQKRVGVAADKYLTRRK